MNSKRQYLTKSIFKIGLECPRKLFYHKKLDEYFDNQTEDSFLQALADGGHQVGALAKLMYPDGHDITTLDYEESLAQTAQLLEKENVVIFEAAFRFKNFFVRSDIVVKRGNSLKIIEVKSKSIDSKGFRDDILKKPKKDKPDLISLKSEWAPYLYDVAFQYWVAKSAHPKLLIIPFLMGLDKWRENKEPNLHTMFLIRKSGRKTEIELTRYPENDFRGFDILSNQDVSSIVEDIVNGKETSDSIIQGTLEEKANQIADIYLGNKRYPANTAISKECKQCQFRGHHEHLRSGFDECWMEATNFKDASSLHMSFDLWENKSSHKHLADGTYLLTDIDPQNLNGKTTKERQSIIIEKLKANDRTPWVNHQALKEAFDDWKWPLHCIDFETCRAAIPFQAGTTPYSQIAFQFSHHRMTKDGKVSHAGEFIDLTPGLNPSLSFLRALKKNLETDDGTILIYSNHENSVLRDLAKNIAASQEADKNELIEFIKTITYNKEEKHEGTRAMVDLLVLLKSAYYSPLMGNSNSIKYVLPAILSESEFLKAKYSQPIYGTPEMPSLNFKDKTWITTQEHGGNRINPYRELKPIFDPEEQGYIARLIDDEDNSIRDGGAALLAYCKTQFTVMTEIEREQVQAALLRYCELDTLAMIMLIEYWRDLVKSRGNV